VDLLYRASLKRESGKTPELTRSGIGEQTRHGHYNRESLFLIIKVQALHR